MPIGSSEKMKIRLRIGTSEIATKRIRLACPGARLLILDLFRVTDPSATAAMDHSLLNSHPGEVCRSRRHAGAIAPAAPVTWPGHPESGPR